MRRRILILVVLLLVTFCVPVRIGLLATKLDVLRSRFLTVKATCYQPKVNQCDATPHITSCGSRINKKDPYSHRWVAVSRDLLNVHVRYGDIIQVTGTGCYDGDWEVRDVMNKRFRRSIDFLIGERNVVGRWDNVIVRINN